MKSKETHSLQGMTEDEDSSDNSISKWNLERKAWVEVEFFFLLRNKISWNVDIDEWRWWKQKWTRPVKTKEKK